MKMENRLNKIIEWGMYLLVFLLPWQTRWIWHEGLLNGGAWEYGTYSLYGTEILLWVLVVLRLFGGKIQDSRFKIPKKLLYCYIAILLFLMWSVLSVWWAEDSGLALYGWLRLFEGVLLFWLIVSTKLDYKKIAGAIVASATFQAGLGIWQFLLQETFASKWLGMALHNARDLGVSVVEVGLERWLRAYGSLSHPNMLAGWLVAGLVMCVGLYEGQCEKDRPSIFKIVILLYCYIVILFGLLATFSRGAWVAFFITLLLYYFITLFRKDKLRKIISFKLLVITILTVAVFGITFKAPFMARVAGQGRLETMSNTERLAGYREAWSLIKDNWFKGVGIGNYTLYLYGHTPGQREIVMSASVKGVLSEGDEARMEEKKAWDYQPVHNLWLLVWTEIGIFGLLFFAGILLSIINYQLSIIRKTRQDIWALNFFIILIVAIILSFFDHYFWSLYFGAMLWWLVLGLTFVLRYDNMKS
ncbi:O-antigen ligase family protein [Patescibacteria group bacterium]|nr:O-antigen ligase family protein [Patescibacteria group bacterium]MBU4511992.1 O-antigen ligase family protein [Patescibacteria group bacterium]MCG2693344.1 O-antigen ligase family protein [Candidatus Parcubacteria bacterium]